MVFDFFGTLTPVAPAQVWANNAASLAAAMGVPAAEVDRVLGETFPERITGALGGVAQTMQALADRLGVALGESQLAQASRVRRERQEAMFALRPEALGVIAALRAPRAGGSGWSPTAPSSCPEAWPGLPLSGLVDMPVFSCTEGIAQARPAAVPKGRG